MFNASALPTCTTRLFEPVCTSVYLDKYLQYCASRVEIEHYSISIVLPCSKRCSADIQLRGRAAKMHEYLISLRSVYEPQP